MNVVVSAIVDPWVTTLSFGVALAMRIQVLKDDERTVVMTSHQVTPEIRKRFHSLVLKDGNIQSETV